MTIAETILVNELKEIKNLLADQDYLYCRDSEDAAQRIGLTNTRDLKKLHEMGVLPRYERGKSFRYKKTDCIKVAAMLDNNEIKL